jgi:excisionase family DNA binding protein
METCMTAKDVAAFVQLSLTTVRRLTMNKEIPFYKINRSVRYRLEEIELWLENRKQAAEKKGKKNDKAAVVDTAKNKGKA